MRTRPTPAASPQDDLRELLRMIRAVIRDGQVSELEAEFLRFWLAAHPHLLDQPPLDRVAPTLHSLAETGEGPEARDRDHLLQALEAAVRTHDAPGDPGP